MGGGEGEGYSFDEFKGNDCSKSQFTFCVHVKVVNTNSMGCTFSNSKKSQSHREHKKTNSNGLSSD